MAEPTPESREAQRAMHNGYEHLAINDTPLRRRLVRLALKTTAHFYKGNNGRTHKRISKNLVVKTGPSTHLTEGATMSFVGKNTSIPVPKVYCSFLHKDTAYIVMERIEGETIGAVPRRGDEAGTGKVLGQLRGMLAELRALRPPVGDDGVASCVWGSLRDVRERRTAPCFGPFETIREFHFWLRHERVLGERWQHISEAHWRDLQDMVAKQDGPWPPPVFTHCDLSPWNIIVRDGNIVGIIDWEFSGWYPHYWEYTAAWCRNTFRTRWRDGLVSILDPYPEELRMEATRRRWWGDYR